MLRGDQPIAEGASGVPGEGRPGALFPAGEVDETPFDVGFQEFDDDPFSDVEALEAAHHSPFHGRTENPHPGAFVRRPGDDPSNRSPILDSRRRAAADLRTCRSTLLALFSCSVQCRARSEPGRDHKELLSRSESGFEQPLGDQIREAAVGGG